MSGLNAKIMVTWKAEILIRVTLREALLSNNPPRYHLNQFSVKRRKLKHKAIVKA